MVFAVFLVAVVFGGTLLIELAWPVSQQGAQSALARAFMVASLLSVIVAALVLPALTRLRQRAGNAEKAINSTNDGYWVLDGSGRFIDVNEGYCRTMGYTRDQVMKLSIADFEAVATAGQIEAQLKRIMHKGNERFETRHRSRTGEWVDLEITVTAVEGRYLVAFLRDISQRKLAEAKIQQLAFFDPLTGLSNRRRLQDRIEQAILISTSRGTHGAILFVDLDNFKLINDTRGHAIGDKLLVEAGERLRGALRAGDTVGRLGGDEFVVIMEALSANSRQAVHQVEVAADAFREALGQAYLLDGLLLHTSASIGAALFFGAGVPMGELLTQADMAMYEAKRGGRNRCVFFAPSMQELLTRRSEVEMDLRRAMARQEFVMYCQPQADHQGRLFGGEVLLRWQHPVRGLVAPLDFIPLAEETALILPIGAWVLSAACHRLKEWQSDEKTQGLQLAVNVSPMQFGQADFVDQLHDVLTASGCNPARLKLELTETQLIGDTDVMVGKMASIIALGVSISMDDFGTGQSSLSRLRRLPLQQIKIDQSFISQLPGEAGDRAVVNAIMAMAEAMNLEVIAEGVETVAQRECLAQAGCLLYQGYLFSKPIPMPDFELKAREGWTFDATPLPALPG